MGLNDTPSAERLHIAFLGCRNAGKSSLVNAVTGQSLAIVSPLGGTTTDPVLKAMELLPLGPVVIIDTPGMDDRGELGELRVGKARQVLNRADLAVLVVDAGRGLTPADQELLASIEERHLPHIVVFNKSDLPGALAPPAGGLAVSAVSGLNLPLLKERLASLAETDQPKLQLVGDLLRPGELVVLVTPIDKSAPKGRLILPQQQTIRDVLEADAVAVVVKEFELREALLQFTHPPALVITDSQVFAKVAADVPPAVPLTSFSILFARYKGFLAPAVRGVAALAELADGDQVLVAEGCSHHRQCDDIGTVKLPRWIRNYTGREPVFTFTAGGDFPEDLGKYRLVVHCGSCMLNARTVRYRQRLAAEQGVPFTNYGVLIAHMQGILRRSLAVFPHLLAELPPED